MSAYKKETLIVDVTRGDCLEANRKSGKSNTGTYFLSSSKDFEKIKSYFNNNNIYLLDLNKIKEYGVLFKEFFINDLGNYNGKGLNFYEYLIYLLSLEDDQKVEIVLRINDTRVFMKFKNNTDVIVNAFRNLLYEDISKICLEKHNDFYYVYPVIDTSKINNVKIDVSKSIILDE